MRPPGRSEGQSRRAWRSLTRALLVGLTFAAGAAYAQASFPPALDPASLSAWLSLETDLKPEQVVAVSRQSVAAVVANTGTRQGARVVVVRTEALTPPADVDPALSASVEVWIDCAGRRTRQGVLTGHRERNLRGVGRMLALQEADWRTPSPGTQLEDVWRSVCDPTFRPPLTRAAAGAGRPRAVAAAPKSRRPPAAASAVMLQVGAYPTRAQAETARAALPASLTTHGRVLITPAETDGRPVFRLLVTGFGEVAQAKAACARLKAAGHACFLRH